MTRGGKGLFGYYLSEWELAEMEQRMALLRALFLGEEEGLASLISGNDLMQRLRVTMVHALLGIADAEDRAILEELLDEPSED